MEQPGRHPHQVLLQPLHAGEDARREGAGGEEPGESFLGHREDVVAHGVDVALEPAGAPVHVAARDLLQLGPELVRRSAFSRETGLRVGRGLGRSDGDGHVVALRRGVKEAKPNFPAFSAEECVSHEPLF